MDRDFSPLDDYLAESDLDGYLLDDGSGLSNQLYLSGFDAEDPFITLYTPGTTALLTSTLEYTRATEESRADQVFRFSDFDYREKIEEHGREAARTMVLVSFLEEFDIEAVGANRRFPLFTADGLREREVAVEPDLDDVLEDIRAIKTPDEVEEIHAAQQANEAAMDRAREMIVNARVDATGELVLDGEPLTSERVRNAIERTLLDRGYALDDTIVASGPQGAVPHDRGSGPIHENEPIIIDIFPRSKETRYHGDLTRTFLKGEPSETVREYFELTREAKAAALSTVEPGATGVEVHEAVCDVYESAGYPTLRTDESTDRGFIHSTGHGVGLDVHELPRISRDGEELEPGHVITIEPGLYHPDVGGVRIEDLVVVTEDGYENLTDYPESLDV